MQCESLHHFIYGRKKSVKKDMLPVMNQQPVTQDELRGTSLITDHSSFIYRATTSSSFHNNTISFMRTLLRKPGILAMLLMFASLFFVSDIFGQITLRGVSSPAGTTTNTSLVINKPSGVVQGDVMIVNIAQQSNNTTNPTLLGWTLVDGRSLAGTTLRYAAVLYKVAGASEPSSYTFTLGAGVNSAVGSIAAFSGVDATGGFLVGGGAGGPFDVNPGTISVQGSQTGVSATAITTATANAAVIMFGQAAGSTPTWSGWNTTSPGTLTEIVDAQQAAGSSIGIAWATKATAGSTGTGTATLSGAERNGAILLALRRLNATITTGAIAGSPFCVTASAGAAVSVPFTSTGTFTGNTYTAQLSNTVGSFASPTNYWNFSEQRKFGNDKRNNSSWNCYRHWLSNKSYCKQSFNDWNE
jgi:hypothetical protein